ncbi:MAG TPA: TadE family protein [Anaerolineales bacterium]|nr:TadE family protein [Anaerolineales bacterium]
MAWRRFKQFLTRHVRRHPGQSLVEFTILLPVLLIMISGLIEFGFMLNYYLDLIDAAREAARWGASADPFSDLTGNYVGDSGNNPFYGQVASVAVDSINIGSGGQISLDVSRDDIVISVFSVVGGSVDQRFPAAQGENGRCVIDWVTGCNHTSDFTSAEINTLLDPAAPDTGAVLVEIWYDYDMILGLPWITAFVPNPVTLYAYSIMPNPIAQVPTPPP